MKTKATTWLAQIAVVLALLATGSASASSGFLAGNSCQGKNSLEGGFYRGPASVSAETGRGYADFCHEEVADSVVAPKAGASITPFKAGTKLDLTGASVGFTKQAYAKRNGYVYVLRDKATGEVLKVGKTSGGVNIYERFNKYRRKSQEFGYKIEAEFWEVGTERQALDLEGQIRRQLKAEGNRLPWDKAANPGRNDLGLPWERSGGTPFEIDD